jgi:phosphoribosylanthranilate isomerase
MHAANPHVDGVLVDSRTATSCGRDGRGVRLGRGAKRRCSVTPAKLKLIAAGGLSPARPWRRRSRRCGLGVWMWFPAWKLAPGRKDASKVHEFVKMARAAVRKRK